MTISSYQSTATAFASGHPRPIFLGMVHLHPLPGSPQFDGNLERVLQTAAADLEALVEGGADGMILENFFDAPFYPDYVPPVTVAAMTSAAVSLRARVPKGFLFGVNVLRNDALASLSIAAVVGASFIRVNVHTGVSVGDQGFLIGRAHETMRLRRQLHTKVSVLADVRVKHADPLGSRSLVDEARDARERALADAILLTGSRTGAPVDPDALVSVRTAVPDAPLLVASGVSPESFGSLAGRCDGVVVGTWLKEGGRIEAPVDVERVRELKSVLQAG